MRRSHVALVVVSCLVSAAAFSAPPMSRPSTRPAFSADRLRAEALSPESTVSIAAIEQLQAAGDAGRPVLLQVLPTVVGRDADQLARDIAAAGDPAAMRSLEKTVGDLRKSAWENLSAISGKAQDPTVRAAHKNYESLSAACSKSTAAYAKQVAVVASYERYARRVVVWKSAGGSVATTAEAALPKLEADVAKSIGMPLADWKQLTEGPLVPPKDANLKHLWLYLAARRIESYNRSLAAELHPQELAHIRAVNFYRELLGVLPYEIDLRLTQSARRHSKEMIDLGYFGHFSPAAADRTCFQRMHNAGYESAAAENLSMGRWTGDEAFWRLFDSASHHKTMVMPWQTTIGVGKWENAWTQNFGSGSRLMLATPEKRLAAMIIGEVLKPQEKELMRAKPPDLTKLDTIDEDGTRRSIRP